jgi:hypothetical protein
MAIASVSDSFRRRARAMVRAICDTSRVWVRTGAVVIARGAREKPASCRPGGGTPWNARCDRGHAGKMGRVSSAGSCRSRPRDRQLFCAKGESTLFSSSSSCSRIVMFSVVPPSKPAWAAGDLVASVSLAFPCSCVRESYQFLGCKPSVSPALNRMSFAGSPLPRFRYAPTFAS